MSGEGGVVTLKHKRCCKLVLVQMYCKPVCVLTLTLAMAQAVITARLCTRMVSSRKLT